MTRSQAWKDLERTAAKKLGGSRIVRGDDFSQHALDVEHETYAIDCKYRAAIAILRWYDKLVVDNKELYPGEDKIPILVLKEKGKRGEFVVIALDDFIKVTKGENDEGATES